MPKPTEYSGFLDLELTSNDWLANHFLAKSHRRFRQINALPINPGDKVLDLCCGPGHYAEMLAHRVGPQGLVCGVDKDPALIDEAERRRSHLPTRDRLEYFCSDVNISSLPNKLQKTRHDVILLFNCISYFPAPQAMLLSYADLLKPAGRLIVKDSDMGHFLISPVNGQLTSKVISAARASSTSLCFDNFFGRCLPELVTAIPSSRNTVEIWSYPMLAPLSEWEKIYIAGNMMTLLAQAEENLSADDCREWTDRYSLESEVSLLHGHEFFFLMHEVVAISTRV